MADSQQLQALFLAGLAVAGCAGGAPRPTPAPGNTGAPETTSAPVATAAPSVTPPSDLPPGPDLEKARAIAREFRSVGDVTKAFPNVEHLASVNTMGMQSPFVCEPSPCTKEWTKLAKEGGGSGAVIRRNGKLEYVVENAFIAKLGVVDTPEKAALRLQFYERKKLATCAQLKTLGVACAPGSDDAGAAVRKVDGGFEVATYGYVNLCSPPSSGGTVGIGFTKVTKDGDEEFTNNALVALSEELLREELGGKFNCKPGNLGRMFEGFEDLPTARSELEYYLCAQRQEAAAVVAFERLAVELAAHGAPADLIASARRSAREERRHAALFRREATRLSEELGVPAEFPAPNTPDSFVIRPLDQILRENIAEGCANETYSAVVATYQAELAPTPRLRAVFGAIAADERGHAALAHRIHAWGLTAVDPETAGALREEQRAANERLRDVIGVTPLGRTMGEPDPALALVAFDHVSSALSA